MDRQHLQQFMDMLQQFGVFHGLLAGLTALIRGAYESEGFTKALLDASLCVIIGTSIFYTPMLDSYLYENPKHALAVSIVVGVVGAKLIITTIRETLTAALKQLNPLNWFRKAK